MPAIDPSTYPRMSLEGFLDQVASPAPAPGGGAVAAVAVALAAGLCAMAVRKSPAVAGGDATQLGAAEMRRRRALLLATEDALAYRRVLDAQKIAGATGPVEPGLDTGLASALSAAADVPLETAAIAAEVAEMAADLVSSGNVNLVGDCLAAALLASGAAEAAAHLVAINLGGSTGELPEERRVEQAGALAGQAATAASRARTAAGSRSTAS